MAPPRARPADWVGLVLRVSLTVVGQCDRFGSDVKAPAVAWRRCGVLVLVIAKVHNEIGMLIGSRRYAATSHSTSTARAGMPPSPSSANGRGASRVQITTPSGAGSPEATPRVNGSAGTGLRRRWEVNPASGSAASTTAPLSTERRLGRRPCRDTDTAKCQRSVFPAGDEQAYGVHIT
jgi:hypothetical protein